MIQGRNNMQMIDVLKRLAELDANNPNIIKESQSVEECGPMGMMGAPEAPQTPATINITAGSGEELSGMLAAIMKLAGVEKVGDEHMGVEHEPAIMTAEPSVGVMPSAGDDMRSVLDKLNPEDSEEETDEGIADRMFDNSPDEEVEGPNAFTDHGDLDKNPAMGGDTAKNHDTRSRVRNQPTATMEEITANLFDEYKQFIAEDMDSEEYVACIVDFNRSGRAIVRRTKPISKERAEEIIANTKAKNTFVHPPFMTIYPASAGNLDGSTIMRQFPDMSKEAEQDGAATFESDIDGGMGYYVVDRFSKEPMDGPFNSPEEANKVNHNGGSIVQYPIDDIGTIKDGNPVTQKQGQSGNKMMYEGDEDAYDQFVNGNEPNFTGRDEEDFDKAQKMFVNFLKKKGKAVDSINDDAFPVLIAMCQGQPCAWYDLENAHGYLAP